MNEIKEKLLRPCRVITDNIIIAIFFSLLLMTAGVMLSGPLIRFTGIKNWAADYFQSDNLTSFFIDYLEFIGLWIAILLAAIIPKKNRPMLRSFLPNRRGNNLKGIIAGIVLGFGANGFCVLMSVLKGDIVSETQKKISKPAYCNHRQFCGLHGAPYTKSGIHSNRGKPDISCRYNILTVCILL